ncbi:VCBS repeat-containing protein [Paenibacillus pinisoli]|uniref:VCBS repeat-containing protein n=1 Tax=Paenibacillus pinisoli TaxID=1276110 RepID=A0A3A6PF60_9BACL|nr:VCBS repeat-containing protein [Paenibacillus pinisoli]RJX39607.1 VCBS repeat-containing protein [Paenibacillus pinisoli]
MEKRFRDQKTNSLIRSGSRASLLLFSLLALAVVAAGCRYTAAPADLLQKPAIAKDKEELSAAIEKALPRFSMLMIPHRDDYKEAIRLLDLNGDGIEEAVVTYYNEYSTPEIVVLRQTEYGWRQSVLVEQPLARDIAWLKLADMDGDGQYELLVGWIGAFDSPNVLELYSFNTKAVRNDKGRLALKPVQSLPYSQAEVGDLLGNGRQELVVIDSLGTSGELEMPSHYLSVYSWQKNALNRVLNMSLPQGTNAFERLLIGKVSEYHNGLVLEGGTGAHSMLTYMYAWESQGLRLIYPDEALGLEGFSGRPTMSGDINGDSIIELQWTKESPGYKDVPYAESIWMNEWMQWDGKEDFHLIAEQFLDYTYGVKLDIPEEWTGSYTMGRPPAASYGIVTFDYWNEAKGLKEELATLYVVPIKQWGNVEAAWKEEHRPYRQLAQDSGNVYLVSFVADVPEKLPEQDKEIFLNMKKVEAQFSSYLKIVHDDRDEWR